MQVYISNSIIGQRQIIESDNFSVIWNMFLMASKENLSDIQTAYILIEG